jgi:hypothetical protein
MQMIHTAKPAAMASLQFVSKRAYIMAPRLIVFCLSVAMLVLPVSAYAQIKEPSPLPGDAAAPDMSQLSQTRAALLAELDELRQHIASHNQRCSHVATTDAALTSSCAGSRTAVAGEIAAYRSALATYEADAMVVDARNVPSGLPKSIEGQIPRTPAGDRVRKGFQAIADHDWNVAHAWFQDALNHDPGNAGIQRLIDLAEYTMKRTKDPHPSSPPRQPVADTSAQDKATMAMLDRQLDAQMDADLAKALYDFNRDYLPERPAAAARTKPVDDANGGSPATSPAQDTANWKAFFDALFSPAPRTPPSLGAVRG